MGWIFALSLFFNCWFANTWWDGHVWLLHHFSPNYKNQCYCRNMRWKSCQHFSSLLTLLTFHSSLTSVSSLKSRLIRVITALTESEISYLRDITFNVNYSVNVSQQLQLHWTICNHLTTDRTRHYTYHLTPAKMSLTRPAGFDFKDNFTPVVSWQFDLSENL